MHVWHKPISNIAEPQIYEHWSLKAWTRISMDVLAEQSLNQRRRGPCTRGRKIWLMPSLNVVSLVLLAVVFDLPVAVQPSMARGDRSERRGWVRTCESERERGWWGDLGALSRGIAVSPTISDACNILPSPRSPAPGRKERPNRVFLPGQVFPASGLL
jgi:hypothetical protein